MIEVFETQEKYERVLNLLNEYGEKGLLDNSTDAIELFCFLDNYNWGDGFEIPYYILKHAKCELAIAMKIFYLSDGLGILDESFEDDFNREWVIFVKYLYENIIKGKYIVRQISYEIPLDSEEKEELKTLIEPIFLQDILVEQKKSFGNKGVSKKRQNLGLVMK